MSVFENNPYQPPKNGALPGRRCKFLKSEIFATIIAIGSSVLLGGGGSLALRGMTLPRGETFTISPTLLYFLVSSVELAGRMPGDLLCGFILGACVRRPQVWWVLGGIAGYLLSVFLGHLGMVGIPDAIPLLALLVTSLIHMGMVCGYVALGIVAGSRVVGLRGTNNRRACSQKTQMPQ